MKRCKHLNVEVVEDFLAASIHVIRVGIHVIQHYNDINGDYTGKFRIKCYDCRREFTFPNYDTAPKWAQRRFDIATTQQVED